MKITTRFASSISGFANAIIIPYAFGKDSVLPRLSPSIKNAVQKFIKRTGYTGKSGEIAFIQVFSRNLSWVVLAGLGSVKTQTPYLLTDTLQRAFRASQKKGAGSVLFSATPELLEKFSAFEIGRLTAEAARVGCYSYTAYKTTLDKKIVTSVTLVTSDRTSVQELNKGAKQGAEIAAAIAMVRDYGNAPSNHITPSVLASMAEKSARETGQKITILNEKQLLKEKMGGILGVSKGSVEEAQFIILQHLLGEKKAAPVVLIGKGITFDSGGISIKPSQAMDEMKFDMAGGASVIGTMHAVGKLNLPINVIGLIPASENVPSGSAYKPGDILTYSDGTTVEVINTDAEGRLILADALLYAKRFKPKAIIDIATLTGAIIVALSDFSSALFSNNEKLAEALQKAAQNTGESLWRMPLPPEAGKRVKSAIADVRNTANKPGGGAITAAKFLEHFVKKGTPWAHLDIAGTAWNTRETQGMEHGATGVSVKTLVEYLTTISNNV